MPRRRVHRQPVLADATASTENDIASDITVSTYRSSCMKRRRATQFRNTKSQRPLYSTDSAVVSSAQESDRSKTPTKLCNCSDAGNSNDATIPDRQPLSDGMLRAALGQRLTSKFFDQPCIQLARSLLGKYLVRISVEDEKRLCGRIVETEAYVGTEDRASHSYGGRRTARNKAMYMPPGTSYVYNIYGIYTCINISSRGMLYS